MAAARPAVNLLPLPGATTDTRKTETEANSRIVISREAQGNDPEARMLSPIVADSTSLASPPKLLSSDYLARHSASEGTTEPQLSRKRPSSLAMEPNDLSSEPSFKTPRLSRRSNSLLPSISEDPLPSEANDEESDGFDPNDDLEKLAELESISQTGEYLDERTDAGREIAAKTASSHASVLQPSSRGMPQSNASSIELIDLTNDDEERATDSKETAQSRVGGIRQPIPPLPSNFDTIEISASRRSEYNGPDPFIAAAWDNEALFEHFTLAEILGGAVHPDDICGTMLLNRLIPRFSNPDIQQRLRMLYSKIGSDSHDGQPHVLVRKRFTDALRHDMRRKGKEHAYVEELNRITALRQSKSVVSTNIRSTNGVNRRPANTEHTTNNAVDLPASRATTKPLPAQTSQRLATQVIIDGKSFDLDIAVKLLQTREINHQQRIYYLLHEQQAHRNREAIMNDVITQQNNALAIHEQSTRQKDQEIATLQKELDGLRAYARQDRAKSFDPRKYQQDRITR